MFRWMLVAAGLAALWLTAPGRADKPAAPANRLEPLVRLLRSRKIEHGFSHSFVGATAVGHFSLVAGRPACQWLLDFRAPDPGRPFLSWLRGPRRIGWRAAVGGAFLGAYSHVWLDSLSHADVYPFAPFSQDNPFLGQSSFEALHVV